MTESLRRAVLEHREASDIRQAAKNEGMVTMREDGFAKAVRGVTTLEDVDRVIRAG